MVLGGNMKKVVIGIIFVILVGIVYLVSTDFSEEAKLKKEIDSVNNLMSSDNIDYETLSNKLIVNVTEGDYLLVEKAVKNYLKDVINNSYDMAQLLNDGSIENILTVDNYENDGPDFKDTIAYINDTREEFKSLKDKILANFDRDEIMEYINNYNLDDYYVDLYEELVFGDEADDLSNTTITDDIDNMIELLNVQEKVINFLKDNKGNWKISGDNISFNSSNLEDKYNDLLGELEDI